jgi:hypothetical protein
MSETQMLWHFGFPKSPLMKSGGDATLCGSVDARKTLNTRLKYVKPNSTFWCYMFKMVCICAT